MISNNDLYDLIESAMAGGLKDYLTGEEYEIYRFCYNATLILNDCSTTCLSPYHFNNGVDYHLTFGGTNPNSIAPPPIVEGELRVKDIDRVLDSLENKNLLSYMKDYSFSTKEAYYTVAIYKKGLVPTLRRMVNEATVG